MALVYEYMQGGNLEDCLRGNLLPACTLIKKKTYSSTNDKISHFYFSFVKHIGSIDAGKCHLSMGIFVGLKFEYIKV
jgi:hypothetical protein